MTTTISVPLDKLVPGHQAKGGSINSRKAEAPVDGLTHSITTHGLLVPLLVRRAEDGESFYVLDGNRRLAALRKLAGPAFPDAVPCIEFAEGNALELSAVINVDREELHPVDRFEVFAALVQAGATVEDLAKRYGIKVAAVRQALALGRMAPEVREAWRAGKIEDDVAEAFTVTTDHKAQAAALKKAGNTQNSYFVRREIAGDVDIASLLKFVGRAAYEKAGYEVNETLFSERDDSDVVVSDIGALKGLATRKLSDACDELTKAGWKWAVTVTDAPKDWRGWRRVQNSNYSKASMAEMGCVVSVDHQSKLHVERGIVKPGDKVATPKAKASPKEQAAAAKEREQRKEETGGLSNALAHRLSQQLTAAVRQAVVDGGLKGDDIVSFAVAALACADGPFKLRIDTIGAERHGNAFAKYYKLARGKAPKERLALLALWLAQSIDLTAHKAQDLVSLLHPGKDDDRDARLLVENIDQAVVIRAARKSFDAADYFASVSKDLILEAVQDALGKEHADRVAKMRAAEAREYAIKHMPKTGWVPEAMRI